ncbi:MAG: hypothetical protein WBZ42_03575 [Halobacteriota archaeon]
MSFFSESEGRWVVPEDERIGDTTADLKSVIGALSNPTNETFVKVDQLLYDYFHLVRHGETRHLSKNAEWILNDSPTGKITVSFKDGSEWFDDCYTDELPLWLLLAILIAIQRRKPLGDQSADDITKHVRDAEAEFIKTRQHASTKGIKLNISRFADEGKG